MLLPACEVRALCALQLEALLCDICPQQRLHEIIPLCECTLLVLIRENECICPNEPCPATIEIQGSALQPLFSANALRNHTSLLVHPLFLASWSASIPQGHVSQHHRLKYLLEQKCFYLHEPLLGTIQDHIPAWCKDTLMLNPSILLATTTT